VLKGKQLSVWPAVLTDPLCPGHRPAGVHQEELGQVQRRHTPDGIDERLDASGRQYDEMTIHLVTKSINLGTLTYDSVRGPRPTNCAC
jgi:hypothetical protein